MKLKRKMILLLMPVTFQAICWLGIISGCSKAKPFCDFQIENGDSIYTSSHVVTSSDADFWIAPDTSSIPYDEDGALIRYGKALVVKTGDYFGPNDGWGYIKAAR